MTKDRTPSSILPGNRTSPEVVQIAITWDGLDDKGQETKYTIDSRVHREQARTHLLLRWLEYFKRSPDKAEIASQLFTSENQYYWTNHPGEEAAPPWQPAQQVSVKLKPWSKENTAECQRTCPKPPPANGQDPLGPFSHYARRKRHQPQARAQTQPPIKIRPRKDSISITRGNSAHI
jgi:hypothetical protein